MEERTRHRAVGAVVLLLAAIVVFPLVLESSPPDQRSLSEPEAADASPDRIRITTFDGDGKGRPSPERSEEVEPLSASTGASDSRKPGAVAPAAGWAVQIGSFADPGNAERLREQVASRGYRALTQTITTREGQARVRVLVGPDRTRAAAAAMRTRLRRDDSIQGFLVRYPG